MSTQTNTAAQMPQAIYVAGPDNVADQPDAPRIMCHMPALRFSKGGRELAVVTLSGYKIGAERSPQEWATLFAAAPDLLNACQRVMQLAVAYEGDEIFKEVRLAIRQAGGCHE